MSYQGNSNVGFRALYESQNQRNHKQSEVEELTRQTGENVKGYLPSTLPHLTPSQSAPNRESKGPSTDDTDDTEDQPGEVNRLHEEEVSCPLALPSTRHIQCKS